MPDPQNIQGYSDSHLFRPLSTDDASLPSDGEDGLVKSWSRTGMFRAQLAQASGTIYTLCWSPESDAMLFSDGKHLVIRPLLTLAPALAMLPALAIARALTLTLPLTLTR